MSYCEVPSFYSEQLVTARKEHKCCETGRIIAKGEKYWRCGGKYDGEMFSTKQSVAAYHFARYINGLQDKITGTWIGSREDECIEFGGVGEYVREFREDHPELWSEWQRVKLGEITRDTTGTYYKPEVWPPPRDRSSGYSILD